MHEPVEPRPPSRRPAALLALLLAACGGSGGADAPPDPRVELGRAVFTEVAQPTCATCHTLEEAGATGQVGPDLDALRPDEQRVRAAVTHGLGIMPAQGDNLTDEQIDAVAHYVARVAGGGGSR